MMPYTWHDWAGRIKEQLSDYRKHPSPPSRVRLQDTIQAAITKPDVVRRGGRLIETNDHGLAYNSMCQTDMGETLVACGIALGDHDLIDTGLSALDVAYDRIEDRGLSRRKRGAWWFHSVTRQEDDNSLGLTLNQHLIAANNFAQVSDALADIIPEASARYENAAVRGMLKMVSGGFPKLKHYIPKDGDGEFLKRSWIYYGMDKDRRGRFLDSDKNGTYHILVMSLIARLHKRFPERVDRHDWAAVMKHLWKVYQTKVSEGLYSNSPASRGGNFLGIRPDKERLNPEHCTIFKAYA